MIVLPFILIAMLYRQHDTALWLFVAAGATDAVDGMVARRFKQQTRLGGYLDPIADKFLLSSAFVVQALIGSIPWWVTILVLSRDVLIMTTALVITLTTPIRDFPPSWLGKANTAVQVVAMCSVVLNNSLDRVWTGEVAEALIWAAAGTTLVSAMHYAASILQRVQEHLGGSPEP